MGAVNGFKRYTAVVTRIKPILEGMYVPSGDEPSHIFSTMGKLFRVNVMATVISSEGMTAEIDDGSGIIQLRSFEENIPVVVGDVVMVVGKPREYSGKKYIVPEITKKIDNPEWLKVRQLQLEKIQPVKEEISVEPKQEAVEAVADTTSYETIAAAIKKLDQGGGADIDEIIKEAALENTEETIKTLLQEGELFEVKPGKLKVLE